MLLVGVGTMATEGVEVDLEGELRRQYYRLAGNFCWCKFPYVLKYAFCCDRRTDPWTVHVSGLAAQIF